MPKVFVKQSKYGFEVKTNGNIYNNETSNFKTNNNLYLSLTEKHIT